MEQEQFRFEIVPLGGLVKKEDRIRRLVPLFEQGRLYLPYHKELEHVNFEGRIYFPVNNFMDEYDKFPYSAHDDLIDAMARIIDAELKVRMPSSDDSRNRVKQYKHSVFGR
jgi:phage terminase large subunit-like protein